MKLMNYIVSNGCNYGNPDTVQWQKKPFADVPLTDEQMDIFNRSFSPDWECRYYPIKFGDYHYLLRSGFWVCKFIYVKGDDGLYHISEFYSNPDKNEHFARLLEIFRAGYFSPSLFTFADFTERYRKAIDEFENINRP